MTDERFYVLEDGWQILVMDRFYCHQVVQTFYSAGQSGGTRGSWRPKADAFCARLNRDESEATAA
jgi:hypothetical protein